MMYWHTSFNQSHRQWGAHICLRNPRRQTITWGNTCCVYVFGLWQCDCSTSSVQAKVQCSPVPSPTEGPYTICVPGNTIGVGFRLHSSWVISMGIFVHCLMYHTLPDYAHRDAVSWQSLCIGLSSDISNNTLDHPIMVKLQLFIVGDPGSDVWGSEDIWDGIWTSGGQLHDNTFVTTQCLSAFLTQLLSNHWLIHGCRYRWQMLRDHGQWV